MAPPKTELIKELIQRFEASVDFLSRYDAQRDSITWPQSCRIQEHLSNVDKELINLAGLNEDQVRFRDRFPSNGGVTPFILANMLKENENFLRFLKSMFKDLL